MAKRYLEDDVYTAANKRLEYIFKNFDRIILSFSGGKDSGVLLNLVVDYMRKHNIKKKAALFFVDLEGQYSVTIDYIKSTIEQNMDLFEPYWCCLPINLRNAVSVFEPFWTCWDLNQKDNWIRKYPDFPCITEQNCELPFFRNNMEFEEFVPEFGEWFADGQKTACLVGIRSDESLNRFRTIATPHKQMLDNHNWTTKIGKNLYNCYPIFDWTIRDVWVANAKFGWEYNKLYDLFYKAGVPLGAQRICQPYGDDQRIGLNLFRVVEAETWAKVVNRVSGANFGNIYSGDKVLGYRRVILPKGHTWKSYTKLLLKTLPAEISANYRRRFVKFVKYWNRKGCPINPDYYSELPKEAMVLDRLTTRGAKNKNVVVYKRIPDYLDNRLEQRRLGPTWRRMAICILKNDQLCKSLSFAQTKKQRERMKTLIAKYRGI